MFQSPAQLTGTRSIFWRVKLKGKNIVNKDGNDQKWMWNNNVGRISAQNDNYTFAKHQWNEIGKTSEGKPIVERKVKISNDALRHVLFSDEIPFQCPNLIADRELLNQATASPAMILRGYLFNEKGEASIRRTSPIKGTDAIQTNRAISVLENCSRSGKKEMTTADEPSDNSFHKKETIGEIEYMAEGGLDIKDLQYISCDDLFDRQAFNPDDFSIYRPYLEKGLNSKVSDPDYYTIKTSVVKLPEYGLLLTDEQQLFLAQLFFYKLLTLSIMKSGGYAEVTSLEIKYCNDPLTDRLTSNDGWVTITHPDQIIFTPAQFYEKAPLTTRERFEKNALQKKDNAKALRQDEKKQADDAKAKRTAQKEKK